MAFSTVHRSLLQSTKLCLNSIFSGGLPERSLAQRPPPYKMSCSPPHHDTRKSVSLKSHLIHTLLSSGIISSASSADSPPPGGPGDSGDTWDIHHSRPGRDGRFLRYVKTREREGRKEVPPTALVCVMLVILEGFLGPLCLARHT